MNIPPATAHVLNPAKKPTLATSTGIARFLIKSVLLFAEDNSKFGIMADTLYYSKGLFLISRILSGKLKFNVNNYPFRSLL